MWGMQDLFCDCFSPCVCSRVFICSLICKHDGQWPFPAALLLLTLSILFELFISEKKDVNQAATMARFRRGHQAGQAGSIHLTPHAGAACPLG